MRQFWWFSNTVNELQRRRHGTSITIFVILTHKKFFIPIFFHVTSGDDLADQSHISERRRLLLVATIEDLSVLRIFNQKVLMRQDRKNVLEFSASSTTIIFSAAFYNVRQCTRQTCSKSITLFEQVRVYAKGGGFLIWVSRIHHESSWSTSVLLMHCNEV